MRLKGCNAAFLATGLLFICISCAFGDKAENSEVAALKNDYAEAISAYNSGNAAKYKTHLCDSYIAAASKITPLDSDEKLRATLDITGSRIVSNVDSVKIEGQQATAEIESYFEKFEKNSARVETLSFANENGHWKLCLPSKEPALSSVTSHPPITSMPPIPE